MTALEENSVLSLTEAPVKADPIEFVVLSRCEAGQTMFSAWMADYNAAAKEHNDRWQDVLYKGFEPYRAHVKACDQCRTFEIAWRVSPADLPQEEKK